MLLVLYHQNCTQLPRRKSLSFESYDGKCGAWMCKSLIFIHLWQAKLRWAVSLVVSWQQECFALWEPWGFWSDYSTDKHQESFLGWPVLWTRCTALKGEEVKDDLLSHLVTWSCSISHLPILAQIDVKMSCRGVCCFNQKSRGIGRTAEVKAEWFFSEYTLPSFTTWNTGGCLNKWLHLSCQLQQPTTELSSLNLRGAF